MVVAADVLWVSSMHDALLATVTALLARTRDARFVLVAGFHTGRPAIARFLDAARAAGLEYVTSAPYGGVYERRFDGATRAWQRVDDEMGDIGERAQWVLLAVFQWGSARPR